MIAPQELRLGNWVQQADAEGYLNTVQVTSLDPNTLSFHPIPITASVLKSFGFAFHNYFKLWQRNKPVLGTGTEMELDPDFWLLDFSHHRMGVEVKSLHQLQNLYFLLKGKELAVLEQTFAKA